MKLPKGNHIGQSTPDAGCEMGIQVENSTGWLKPRISRDQSQRPLAGDATIRSEPGLGQGKDRYDRSGSYGANSYGGYYHVRVNLPDGENHCVATANAIRNAVYRLK